jgi:5'-methylthioadenosine phosphorylase
MMKKRKLGIIGGSGLYKMEGFETTNGKKFETPWGKPSDEILIANLEGEEICFIPRHSRGHKINPTNINFRANIDAMKQFGVTDIISVSAVGSLKEELNPGKFVIVDQFIDRTFSRVKTFLMKKL